jgi:hypothetical protein
MQRSAYWWASGSIDGTLAVHVVKTIFASNAARSCSRRHSFAHRADLEMASLKSLYSSHVWLPHSFSICANCSLALSTFFIWR